MNLEEAGVTAKLEKIKFGGLFGNRWKPTDRLFILGLDEESREEFTFVGQHFRDFLTGVPIPWLNSSDPSVRTKAFWDAVEPGWSRVSAFEYVGSTPASSRYRRHCVLVQTWHVPPVAMDTQRIGFQLIGADVRSIFSRSEQALVEQMRAHYRSLAQQAVA